MRFGIRVGCCGQRPDDDVIGFVHHAQLDVLSVGTVAFDLIVTPCVLAWDIPFEGVVQVASWYILVFRMI